METVLKMGILQFTTTVYWVRVVLFLFPFIHTMGLIMIDLMYLPTNNIFLVNPVIYVAMSKLVRNYVVNIFKNPFGASKFAGTKYCRNYASIRAGSDHGIPRTPEKNATA